MWIGGLCRRLQKTGRAGGDSRMFSAVFPDWQVPVGLHGALPWAEAPLVDVVPTCHCCFRRCLQKRVACWRSFCRALCRLCSSCSSSSKKQIEFLLLGCCPSTTPSTWPSELACLLVPLPHSWLCVCSGGIFVREALPLSVQQTTDVYSFHLCLERGL